MATDAAAELAAALPGYDIGGELGRGAFGVVLAGRHRQLARQVAIKQLPRSFSDHPEVRHRFSAEAKILASLDHPHIVPIFDYVEQGGLCVLVMELLPGGTVRQRQSEGLNHQVACAIGLATCSALDYAHQRGVLHRDVKPDNLLFTSAGLLKVTDFGIAKVVGDAAVTQVGETPGTPLYMAPEQCLNQPLGPATDVYSTGVMLYELLAGQHPFAGSGDVVSTMYRQIHEEARPLRSVSRAVPESLEPVVMRALAKDPAARYRSARAFGGALAEAASGAWGSAWPAGEAVRTMSVGPIEAATGWPLTTGPIDTGFGHDQLGGARETIRLAGAPADAAGTASPLPPTVLRADAGGGAAPGTAAAGSAPPGQPAPPWTPPQSAAPWSPSAPPATWTPSQPATPWIPSDPATPWTPPESAPSWIPSDPGAPPAEPWTPPATPWAPARPDGSWPPAGSWSPAGPVPTEGLPYPASAQTVQQFSPPAASPANPSQLSAPPPGARTPMGRRPMIALVAVLFVILAAIGVLLVTKPGDNHQTSPGTTAPSPPTAVQEATALNRLIQQSSTARNQVVNTVASIQNCSANAQTAASALMAAETTRQEVAKDLAALPVTALPNGAAMQLAMTNALNDSIDADRHFEAWLAGITAAGGCTGQAPHDANWTAAQVSSAAATGAKATFAALWNPVAVTYGLPKVSSASI